MATTVSSCFQADWAPPFAPTVNPLFEKISQLIQRVLSIALYPICAMRNLLQNFACRLIMPGFMSTTPPIRTWWELAKCISYLIWNPDAYKTDLSEYGQELLQRYKGKKVFMKTPDGTQIEGAFFRNSRTDRVIVFSGGNGSQWELESKFVDLLQPLGVSIMLLNPRGLGGSKGNRSTEGWAQDFYTACEFLFQKEGFSPDKCLPMGFSMGGATASRGAALIQAKYPSTPISVLNLCSFSNLNTQIDTMFRKTAAMLAKIALYSLGITIDVTNSWASIKGKKVVMYRPDDKVISHLASMASASKKDPSTRIIALNPKMRHNDPFSPDEKNKILSEARSLLNLPQPLFG